MTTNKKKASKREATPGQRVFVARITGEDNRGTFLSFEDADQIITAHVLGKAKKSLMAGKIVRSTFYAQAKALYEWAQKDKNAPDVHVVKIGRAWEFRPAKATASGFPD